MFAILVSGLVSAQLEFGLNGNMLIADTTLGEDIQTGSGFTVNANYDLFKKGFVFGPSVTVASFGDVRAAHSDNPRREISSFGSYGLQLGFASGESRFIVSYELPFETTKGEGVIFESMLSGKFKNSFKKGCRLGYVLSYDYFFNKDTFYYTSQAGVGLYYKL